MKRVVLIILVAMVTGIAVAQPRLRQPEMYIGVHGGALFSMTLFTPRTENANNWFDRMIISGNGGMVFRYNGHKVCGLQVELNYMQRGWQEKVDDLNGVDVRYIRRLNYFEIPFLAHIYFGKKMVRGFVNLGPQVGYCFYESESGTKNPVVTAQYEPIDNKVDWGVAGGLGMLVRSSEAGTFQLEARFNYSLGDCFYNKKTDFFSHSNAMNLSVNIGYLWELKPKIKTKKKTE